VLKYVISRFQATRPVYLDGRLNQFITVRKNTVLSRVGFLIPLKKLSLILDIILYITVKYTGVEQNNENTRATVNSSLLT
jgi:hypothetical protein